MKKFLMRLSISTLIMVLILSQITVFAATGTYRLYEMGLNVTIPSGYMVITKDTPSTDAVFNKLGASKSELMDLFEERDIYLNAISDSRKEEIVVTGKENILSDFTLLSDTVLKSMMSGLLDEFNKHGASVIKYDIYNHSQAKFVRIYWVDTANSRHGLQYYTVRDGIAMNFTIQSYEGSITSRQESVMKTVVDSVKYDKASPDLPDAEDTDSFAYTDSDSGVKFTVPANWVETEFTEEREYLDVKFSHTKDEACIITFSSMDVWEEVPASEKVGMSREDIDNSIFNKSDIAEMAKTTEDNVSTVTYNGVEYYKCTTTVEKEIYGLSLDLTMTQLLYVNNGWMYTFRFAGTQEHELYSDFEKLVSSVEYSFTPTIDEIGNINPEDISIEEIERGQDKNKFYINLPLIILSIVITLVAYGAFPVLFAKIRQKPITQKKYKSLCYGINAAAMLVFLVLSIENGEEAYNFVPYILWTTVFSSYGIKTLGKRGIMQDSKYYQSPDCENQNVPVVGVADSVNNTVIAESTVNIQREEIKYCRKCGARLIENSRFCIQCGAEVSIDYGNDHN